MYCIKNKSNLLPYLSSHSNHDNSSNEFVVELLPVHDLVLREQQLGRVLLHELDQLVELRSSPEDGAVKQARSHQLRVDVGGRPPILLVTLPVSSGCAWHTHGGASVSHAPGKLVQTRSLVQSSEPLL